MSARPKPSTVILIVAFLSFVVATLAAAADPLVHTVLKGETLYAIAKRYDISVESLMKANAIADPGRLFVGMRLSIPGSAAAPAQAVPGAAARPDPTTEYVVVKGDTMYGIAKAHGLSVEAILKASGLSKTIIKPGQKLRLPVSSASSIGHAAPAPTPVPARPAPSTSVAAVTKETSWPASGQVSYLQGKLKGVSIDVEPSTPIIAIRSGTVISAGPFRGFGLVAFVQSSDGLVYVYGGAAALSVKIGESVRKGSTIGKAGTDGETSAYFFIFKGADTIDPGTAPRD